MRRTVSDTGSDWDYLGAMYFQGEDSSGNTTSYSTITGRIEESYNGNETGRMEQYNMKDGQWTRTYIYSPKYFFLMSDQYIQWNTWNGSSYDMNLQPTTTLTADRTVTLPDQTGTVVLADSSGNVGVGTTGPDEKMHLYTSSGKTVYKAEVNANSTVGLEIKKTGSTTQSWRIVDGETVNCA